MLRFKRIITVCLLIMFSFVAISPAYANSGQTNMIDSGQYVEDGILHEYTIIKKFSGDILATSYIYEDNEKVVDEQFVVRTDGKNIYIDGEKVAEYIDIAEDSIVPNTIINSEYHSGKCVKLITDGLTVFQIAVTITGGLLLGTWTSIGVSLVATVASLILTNKLDTVFYEQYIILETFPEDRPGISVRETNKVRYYRDMYYKNPIDDWVTNVHEEI